MSRFPALLLATTLALVPATASTATADETKKPNDAPALPQPPKTATATGTGGAVSSVDPYASQIGLDVLQRGGNAVDAAVATAAALGVTEPYSAGVGGGGYFVYYDAASEKVTTIDGRETAPATLEQNDFLIDPATRTPHPFGDLVSSGLSVGVPGTPATWDEALDRWGTLSLKEALRPAADLARRGFVVDPTFALQTRENEARFRTFTSTVDLLLENGVPQAGSTFRNPDLAQTYQLLGAKGIDWFYEGALAEEIAETVQHPPVSGNTSLPAFPGEMTTGDLAAYDALVQEPTHVGYRGHDVYGMAPSSSGGTTVGESLNILEQFDLAAMDPVDALHHYFEASRLAFADRGAYVGDPAFVDVPTEALLDDTFAKERACLIDPDSILPEPVAAGDVTSYDGVCAPAAAETTSETDTEGRSTTHLTTADRWGNVVAYTLTIEQTGGSGIVVPGRGFLLNNELTDFDYTAPPTAPNQVAGGKRPRSSMSPTIVLQDGAPVLALGSPGGSTIITTVLQVLMNRLDLGMTLPEAVAAPRATKRTSATVTAEQAFLDLYRTQLERYGHTFALAGPAGSSASEIGAVAAIEFGDDGSLTAAAEPVRRGGGAARVVQPR